MRLGDPETGGSWISPARTTTQSVAALVAEWDSSRLHCRGNPRDVREFRGPGARLRHRQGPRDLSQPRRLTCVWATRHAKLFCSSWAADSEILAIAPDSGQIERLGRFPACIAVVLAPSGDDRALFLVKLRSKTNPLQEIPETRVRMKGVKPWIRFEIRQTDRPLTISFLQPYVRLLAFLQGGEPLPPFRTGTRSGLRRSGLAVPAAHGLRSCCLQRHRRLQGWPVSADHWHPVGHA